MKKSITPFFLLPFILSSTIIAQPADWDQDADAMPDYWEFYRGLNPEEAKDAWLDSDLDGYLNLYEYFLGSDPQNPAQPFIIELERPEELAQTILNAPRGAVLRVPAGTYDLNFSFPPFNEAPRLMIEGGWSADFSTRDYCSYQTTFNGQNLGSILDFQLFEGNSGALILDGITFMQGNPAAIRYYGVISKVQLSILNCTFIDNQSGRTTGVIETGDGPFTLITDFIIANTLVAKNRGNAITIKIHANKANLMLYHSVVANQLPAERDALPYESGHGLRFKADADTAITVQIANTIFWENQNADLIFEEVEAGELQLLNDNNNYQELTIDSSLGYQPPPSNRSTDPGFEAPEQGNYNLSGNSTLLGRGRDLGLKSEIGIISLGLLSCGDRSTVSLRQAPITKDLAIFPNPAVDQVTLITNEVIHQEAILSVLDIQGNVFQTIPLHKARVDDKTYTIHTLDFPSGTYLIELKGGYVNYQAKLVILRP